jgi:hypothetical protein
LKNISTKKLNYLFLCSFFSLSLLTASCVSNAPPPPEEDPLYQALNSESPGAIPGRPPAPAGFLSQDPLKSPADSANIASAPSPFPPASFTSPTIPGMNFAPTSEPTSAPANAPSFAAPTQAMPDIMAPEVPSSANQNAPIAPTFAAPSYPNPYANVAPTAPNIAENPAMQQPIFIPQEPAPQAEPEPDFDFSNASCNIDEDGINEIIVEVKKRKNNVIKTLPNCLKLNRSLMMRAAIIDPSEFEYASDILKEDESFVHRMIEINPEILKFAAQSLRRDHDFMEQATYLNRNALQYADPKLLDNKIFIRNMIKIDAQNYMFASDRLKENTEFATTAFADNGMLLKYAPDSIKNDKKIVTIAVKSNADALQYAGDKLKADETLKKLAIKKSSLNEEELKKFLKENYLNDSDKKNVGIIIDNRMKFFADNKIIDRNYVTKWQRNYDPKVDILRLIPADSRNFPISWKDDFKKFPILIDKIEKFLLSHQVDQTTIDNLSTVYFWKVKKKPQTVVFRLYLLRDSKDFELGPKFGNVTSLTAIAQKNGEVWSLSIVEVIFDSNMKLDLAYENGHKQYVLWDLYQVDDKDKNPKLIFKVEDKFNEYFEIFEEQNNGKYRMIQRVDSLKDAMKEDEKPAKSYNGDDNF